MISRSPFGTLPTGQAVDEYTLTNSHDMVMRVITYGGIVTQLHLPDRDGKMADVVCGFDNLNQYVAGHPYFGSIIGRVAGRITRGRYTLDGVDYSHAINDPPNHLHGGLVGFDKRIWTADTASKDSVRLSYLSSGGEEGYPGNVRVSVTYHLTDADEFIVDYEAITDRATPLSLTHHGYYNLFGEGSARIDDHVLQVFAKSYFPADERMTLLGRREFVAGRANDFTSPRRIGDVLPELWKSHGDLYLVRDSVSLEPTLIAKLSDPHSGRVMSIRSTEPCVQFYTGVSLDGTLRGKSGRSYGRHSALCLECQRYPDVGSQSDLSQIVLRPGEKYRQTTVHTFSVE
jgi:aldose 1-epimerase